MSLYPIILKLRGRSSEPPLSPSGQANIYYDPENDVLKVSKNGSVYATLGGGAIPDPGTVTNDMLATDVKVGSLAALTTDEKSSVVGAINEVDANCDAKYEKPVDGIPKSDLAAAVQASLDLADTALQPGELTLVEGTPVNAVAASGTLTITGVVVDGETVTIGDEVYEFCADDAQSLSEGSDYAVDITSYATKAQGTLTVDTQPTAGDTMTIGSKTYTFVPAGTANADGEISIGADLAAAQANIVAAINGTDGRNTAHTLVSAADFSSNQCVITALVGGTAGNSIATTETFTAGSNVFDAATLGTTTAGTDCSASNAATALVASITANSAIVTASADAGDVTVTAATKGAAGNSIETTETMVNGSFGGGALSGGVDGTVGSQWELRVDSSYLYICIDDNTVADTNWRRISLGTAY